VGLIVGPVGAVIAMNSTDISQLVFPAKVKEIIGGAPNYLLNTNCGDSNNYTASILNGLVLPKVVNVTVNESAKTFVVVVNVTNNLNHTLSLNNLTATLRTNQDHNTLLGVKLKEPVIIAYNKTSPVILTGYWTQTAEKYFHADHSHTTNIGVELVNVSIDINKLSVKFDGPVNVGNIPIIWER
jgi:hypothetical protein